MENEITKWPGKKKETKNDIFFSFSFFLKHKKRSDLKRRLHAVQKHPAATSDSKSTGK